MGREREKIKTMMHGRPHIMVIQMKDGVEDKSGIKKKREGTSFLAH